MRLAFIIKLVSVLNSVKPSSKSCSTKFIRACCKIKKSVGRAFDTSRCCRKWYSIKYTKRNLRNCEWPLKILGEKINTYWENSFSRIEQNVHLSDVLDKFEVIRIFHLFLYSIEINLFKQVLWDKMTIDKLKLYLKY